MNPDGSGSGNDDNQEEGDPNGETSGGGSSGDGDGKDETDVDDIEMNMESKDSSENASSNAEEEEKQKEKEKKEMVEKMMEDFKEQWEPAVDKLEKASKAFEGLDLNDLTEGPKGSIYPKVCGKSPDGKKWKSCGKIARFKRIERYRSLLRRGSEEGR